MFKKIFKKILDTNQKELNSLQNSVEHIGSLEKEIKKLKETDFAKKTQKFRELIKQDKMLDDILPEAFALVREAAFRKIGERHYDVQMIAAIVLHQGKVVEQKTGEGKTLSAIPALYLNALSGRGTHLVTVNDYLARRDCGWMGPIFHVLGLSTSAMISERSFLYDPEYVDESATDWRLKHLKPTSRRDAYKADITYGINSEFGFDYLRDNMVSEISQKAQRGYHYAIVDEVDSVLIDEARTPHIISAPDTEATHKYYDYAALVNKLSNETDYSIDEKLRTAHLTDHGLSKVEKMLGQGNIYENDFDTVHHIEAALKARTLFQNDKDYIVKEGRVVIVDEFTGRLLEGRRYSEGIHQAIEAKENVAIQQESKTLATVSLQNYFRMYEKLAGMTGTAATEAEEFKKIYNLDVIVVPTNKPIIRIDHPDSVYKTTRAKYSAITDEIAEKQKKGQPVLIGTTSIEKNEIISQLLKRKGVAHQLLNAKNHSKEALIISQAGNKGAVTVATNMAGRGVDIVLGGAKKEKWEIASQKEYEKQRKSWQKAHDEIIELGGLHVIGTERHESRRIDNQLRGRSGRQGDPGSSRFYVSLEDDIMRLFGGDQVSKLMTVFKLPEDVPLEHSMVSKAIEQAQTKVEGFHFDSRKHLVEYDDVLNKHREIVYEKRKSILELDSQKEEIIGKIKETIERTVNMHVTEEGQIDREKIMNEFSSIIPFDESSQKRILKQFEKRHEKEKIQELLSNIAVDLYENREKQLTPEVLRQVERWTSLSVIDKLWMDHLDAITNLREGIGLRGYGQRDPLVEYKNEAYMMFERLISSIDTDIVHRIYKVQVAVTPRADQAQNAEYKKPDTAESLPQETKLTQEAKRARTNIGSGKGSQPYKKASKIGRNDPCWCGSGKKWKKCHYPEMG